MKYALKAVVLSHEYAPVETRELIYLSEDICKKLLHRTSEVLGLSEVLIFSTCNRSEVYYVSEVDLSREIISLLCMEKGITDSGPYRSYFRIIDDNAASVEYLFEVSMGLHSTVLGDIQIANQIKKAYSWSHELQLAGAFMHRLLHTIFHTNKRVHQETAFRDGAASVSYAATELAESLITHLDHPRILVIGLGEMGSDVARNLDSTKFKEIYLSNRTISKAKNLALETGAQVIPYEHWPSQLTHFDVIISAVSVSDPIISSAILPEERLHSQFFIDLSVPRSIDPDVENLPYVICYNVDDIQSRTQEVLNRRRESIAAVKQIIREEITAFHEWQKELIISPTIHKIKAALEQIRREELSRFLKDSNDKESQLLEDVTLSMLNKILRMPVLHLKAACKRGEQENLIDVLNQLFDLENQRRSIQQKKNQ